MNGSIVNNHENGTMQILTINIPVKHREVIDTLVLNGVFPSRSEFIRDAIRTRLLELETLGERIESILNDPNVIRIPNGDGTYNEVELVRRLE